MRGRAVKAGVGKGKWKWRKRKTERKADVSAISLGWLERRQGGCSDMKVSWLGWLLLWVMWNHRRKHSPNTLNRG